MSRRSTIEDLRVELDKIHIATRGIERVILQLEEEDEQRRQQQQQRKTPKTKDRLTDSHPKDRDGEEISRKHKFRHTWFSDITGEAYTDGIAPEEEDIVRIVNPNKGQAKLGQIIGFCKDGKVKIDTDQETPIIRAPTNIRLLYREDEASSFF